MLLLSAFFSGMEIAFLSKNRLREEIDRKQSPLFDFIAQLFERHSGQYITTILVGNNICLVIYSLYMSIMLHLVFDLVGWDGWVGVSRRGDVSCVYTWLLCPWGHNRVGHDSVTKRQ